VEVPSMGSNLGQGVAVGGGVGVAAGRVALGVAVAAGVAGARGVATGVTKGEVGVGAALAGGLAGLSSHQRSRAVWVGPVEAPEPAEGGAGGVGGGGVGGGGVGVGGGSEPGSERTPPGIQLARGSMSSALRREVAAPMPPPEGFDRSPCQVTLAVALRTPPFVQPPT